MALSLNLHRSIIAADTVNQNCQSLAHEPRGFTYLGNRVDSVRFSHSAAKSDSFKLAFAKSDFSVKAITDSDDGLNGKLIMDGLNPTNSDGDSGDGGGGSSGGGGGSGDDGEDGNDEEEEFGPLLKYSDVMREADKRGVKLPADMVETAKSVGIRQIFLLRYLDFQVCTWFIFHFHFSFC